MRIYGVGRICTSEAPDTMEDEPDMSRRTQKSEKEAERYALTERMIVGNASLDGGYIGTPFDGASDRRELVLKPVPAYSTKQLTQKDQLLLASGTITFQEVKAASMIDRRGILRKTSNAMKGYNGIDTVSEFSMNSGDVRAMTMLLNRFKGERNATYSFTLDGEAIRESFPDTQRGAMMLIDRPILDINGIADMCNGRHGDFAIRVSDGGVMFDLHQFTSNGRISGTPEYPDMTLSFGMIPSREQDEIGGGKSYDWKYCIYQHSRTAKIPDASAKEEYLFNKVLLRSVLSYFGIVPEMLTPRRDENGEQVFDA